MQETHVMKITLNSGDKYGKLTILEEVETKTKNNVNYRYVRCKCECGKVK